MHLKYTNTQLVKKWVAFFISCKNETAVSFLFSSLIISYFIFLVKIIILCVHLICSFFSSLALKPILLLNSISNLKFIFRSSSCRIFYSEIFVEYLKLFLEMFRKLQKMHGRKITNVSVCFLFVFFINVTLSFFENGPSNSLVIFVVVKYL